MKYDTYFQVNSHFFCSNDMNYFFCRKIISNSMIEIVWNLKYSNGNFLITQYLITDSIWLPSQFSSESSSPTHIGASWSKATF